MHSPEHLPVRRAERVAPRRHAHHRPHTVVFLAASIALWLYVGLVPLHLLHNPILVPTWFLLGAATVPATIFWVMIHRLRTTDTVTVLKLVFAATVGGALAVVLGGSLDSLVALVPQENRMLSLSVAGFVEEFAKGVLIVAVGWHVAKTARNGLFVGGAVGLGFAVLETIGYIAQAFEPSSSLLAATGVTVIRGLTAPFGHVLWSSLLGATLFAAAARRDRFRLTLPVLGAYVGVAVLHGIWDGSASIAEALTTDLIVRGAALLFGVVIPVVVGGLVWMRVVHRAPAPLPVLPPAAADASAVAAVAPAAAPAALTPVG